MKIDVFFQEWDKLTLLKNEYLNEKTLYISQPNLGGRMANFLARAF